jgi:hypothetical protein
MVSVIDIGGIHIRRIPEVEPHEIDPELRQPLGDRLGIGLLRK